MTAPRRSPTLDRRRDGSVAVALTAACLAVLVAVVAGVLLVWPAVG